MLKEKIYAFFLRNEKGKINGIRLESVGNSVYDGGMSPRTACFLLSLLLGMTACSPSPRRLIHRGEQALAAGEPALAAEKLAQGLEGRMDDPDAAPYWLKLGVARSRAGLGGVEEALRTAVAFAEHDPLARMNLGVFLLEAGVWMEARMEFQAALEVAEDPLPAAEFLAETLVRQGQTAEARRLLLPFAELSPGLRLRTSLAALEPDPAEAIRMLEAVLAEDAAFAPAAWNLAVLLDRQGLQPGRAVFNYERFLLLEPQHPEAAAVRRRVEGLKTRLGQQPANVDPFLRQFQQDLAEVERLGREGAVQQALMLALRAGVTAGRQQRPDLEETALRTAVRVAPLEARAHFALARLLIQQGRPREGRQVLETSARLAGENPAALGQIADLFETGLQDAAAARRIRAQMP